jgi:hypothetical protein
MKAAQILVPFFFWTREIWGNLLCDDCLTFVKYAVRRSECVWVSATTVAAIWCTASLIVLSKCLIEGPQISFLWRWPKILLPIIWWPTIIRINIVHQLRVVALTIIVARGP